ncbi:MAG: hypothetical protein JKY04_08515, partial [Sneathiella sp.]|nr:hypothetical protein [Sneathiella sp.]
MQDTRNYRPYVASDLEWAIRSPLLTKIIPEPNLSSFAETSALIASVKENPEPLLEFLA